MSRERGLLLALAGLALAGGAFALGVATAPSVVPEGAPSVEGPRRLNLPALTGVAPLPQPHEAPVAAAESAPEESEAAAGEAAPEAEAPAPAEAAPESPAPEEASPPPSGGGEEVVPEGL
ncbi:MAG: hypothetical protein ACRDLL_00870 [Solirubrobacterales bacterium]